MPETSPPSSSPASSIPAPPSHLPPPTGNLFRDVIQSVRNITDIPCARNSLLGGIASGAGIGIVRGMSAGPLVAGHWATATFAIISIGSWSVTYLPHLCQRQLANERTKIKQVIESMPRRVLKQGEEQDSSSNSTTP